MHGALEGFFRPVAYAGFEVWRNIGGIDGAKRRFHFVIARQFGAATSIRAGMALCAVPFGGHNAATLDLFGGKTARVRGFYRFNRRVPGVIKKAQATYGTNGCCSC